MSEYDQSGLPGSVPAAIAFNGVPIVRPAPQPYTAAELEVLISVAGLGLPALPSRMLATLRTLLRAYRAVPEWVRLTGGPYAPWSCPFDSWECEPPNHAPDCPRVLLG